MSTSLSIASTGLQAAGRRFDTAARSPGAPASQRKEEADAPGAAASSRIDSKAARPTRFNSRLDTSKVAENLFDRSDSAERLIAFKRAEAGYKVQADLLKTVSRHQDKAIDRLT